MKLETKTPAPDPAYLRALGTWLNRWAAFALAQAEVADDDRPPAHWQQLAGDDEPPAHWLALLAEYGLTWPTSEAKGPPAAEALPLPEGVPVPPADAPADTTTWLAALQAGLATFHVWMTGEWPAADADEVSGPAGSAPSPPDVPVPPAPAPARPERAPAADLPPTPFVPSPAAAPAFPAGDERAPVDPAVEVASAPPAEPQPASGAATGETSAAPAHDRPQATVSSSPPADLKPTPTAASASLPRPAIAQRRPRPAPAPRGEEPGDTPAAGTNAPSRHQTNRAPAAAGERARRTEVKTTTPLRSEAAISPAPPAARRPAGVPRVEKPAQTTPSTGTHDVSRFPARVPLTSAGEGVRRTEAEATASPGGERADPVQRTPRPLRLYPGPASAVVEERPQPPSLPSLRESVAEARQEKTAPPMPPRKPSPAGARPQTSAPVRPNPAQSTAIPETGTPAEDGQRRAKAISLKQPATPVAHPHEEIPAEPTRPAHEEAGKTWIPGTPSQPRPTANEPATRLVRSEAGAADSGANWQNGEVIAPAPFVPARPQTGTTRSQPAPAGETKASLPAEAPAAPAPAPDATPPAPGWLLGEGGDPLPAKTPSPHSEPDPPDPPAAVSWPPLPEPAPHLDLGRHSRQDAARRRRLDEEQRGTKWNG